MVTIIARGTVYDGSGEAPRRADVLIRGGVIARIGSFARRAADRIIDASGCAVMPGFIDAASTSDRFGSIFSHPQQTTALLQGVTTVVVGHDGWSLSPTASQGGPSHEAWGHPSKIAASWHTTKELLAKIRDVRPGVNIATLVGLDTVRSVCGGSRDIDPTEGESRIADTLLVRSLKEGAVGVSVAAKEHGALSTSDLSAAARAVKAHHATLSVWVGTNAKLISDNITKAVTVAADSRVPLFLHGLQPSEGMQDVCKKALSYVTRMTDRCECVIGVHPIPLRERSLTSFAKAPVMHAAHRAHLGHVFDRSLRFLEGKPLDELAQTRNISMPELLALLMRLTKGKATVVSTDVSRDALGEILASPLLAVTTDAPALPSGEYTDARARESFPRFLGRFRDGGTTSLETMVPHTARTAATIFRLGKRGLLREGYAADVVVMRHDGEYEITDVFVGGTHAVERGSVTGLRGGAPVFHGA